MKVAHLWRCTLETMSRSQQRRRNVEADVAFGIFWDETAAMRQSNLSDGNTSVTKTGDRNVNIYTSDT